MRRSRATSTLAEHHGDVDAAIKDVIENHVRMAGAQGFLTNIGGLVTMAVTVPDQHRRARADPVPDGRRRSRTCAATTSQDRRTRNAILASLLGEERLLSLIKRKKLPGTPMAIATAPVHDPHLDTVMANEVAAELVTRVAGKRIATTVGRRVPVVGGLVGAGTDGYSTWKIGRYVDRELLPRNRR